MPTDTCKVSVDTCKVPVRWTCLWIPEGAYDTEHLE